MRNIPILNLGVSFGLNIKADNFSWADWDIKVIIGAKDVSARWLIGNLPIRESDGVTLHLSGDDLRVNIDNIKARELGIGEVWVSVVLTRDNVEKRANWHGVTIARQRDAIEAPTTEFGTVVIFDDPLFQSTIQMFDRVGIDGEDGTGGTKDHRLLEYRDEPDQHPIESITGLQNKLEGIDNSIGNINTVLDRANTNLADILGV